jgi:DNA-binding CsgD family transcriptional regulator
MPETMHAMHVGETTVHRLIKEGELTRIRIGARAFVTVESVTAYLERQAAAERAAAEGES